MVGPKWVTPITQACNEIAQNTVTLHRWQWMRSYSLRIWPHFLLLGGSSKSKWLATSSMTTEAKPRAKNCHWWSMAVPTTVMRVVQATAIFAFLLNGFIFSIFLLCFRVVLIEHATKCIVLQDLMVPQSHITQPFMEFFEHLLDWGANLWLWLNNSLKNLFQSALGRHKSSEHQAATPKAANMSWPKRLWIILQSSRDSLPLTNCPFSSITLSAARARRKTSQWRKMDRGR